MAPVPAGSLWVYPTRRSDRPPPVLVSRDRRATTVARAGSDGPARQAVMLQSSVAGGAGAGRAIGYITAT